MSDFMTSLTTLLLLESLNSRERCHSRQLDEDVLFDPAGGRNGLRRWKLKQVKKKHRPWMYTVCPVQSRRFLSLLRPAMHGDHSLVLTYLVFAAECLRLQNVVLSDRRKLALVAHHQHRDARVRVVFLGRKQVLPDWHIFTTQGVKFKTFVKEAQL